MIFYLSKSGQFVSTLLLLFTWSAVSRVQGGWTYGYVDYFDSTTGRFTGHVCVDIVQSRPVCGWRVELYFYDSLVTEPTTSDATLDKSWHDYSWYEYVNKNYNGDLRITQASCLNISIQGTSVDSNRKPVYDARMMCACYLV